MNKKLFSFFVATALCFGTSSYANPEKDDLVELIEFIHSDLVMIQKQQKIDKESFEALKKIVNTSNATFESKLNNAGEQRSKESLEEISLLKKQLESLSQNYSQLENELKSLKSSLNNVSSTSKEDKTHKFSSDLEAYRDSKMKENPKLNEIKNWVDNENKSTITPLESKY